MPLLVLLVFTFLLLPLVALFLHVSWAGILQGWTGSGLGPLGVSLGSTAVALILMVAFGTPVAWLLARSDTRLSHAAEFLLLIPLLMPPLVVGLLLIYLYGPYGLLGGLLNALHLSGSNSYLALIVAQIYEAIPYYIFAAMAAFSQVGPALERDSLALGVPPVATFLQVTFPMALPGLTVGFAMAFARAIGAFGAVIVVAYYPHSLPISIWIALEEQGLPQALPLALLLLLVALPLPLAVVLWRRARYVSHQP